ncbi:molybdopterin-dependent oxidoreductase [Roseovarius indicus]|uniref:molybdopterin-dependent oxidoreductase n=1 Tax=Roseovarius indicus TaxID=540747 RepID=UPI0032EE1E99
MNKPEFRKPRHSSVTDGDIPGYCTFCRSRCGTLNRVRNGRLVSVQPLPEHPTGKAICPKGRAAPEVVHSARRLTKPLRRTRPKGDEDPGFEEISWDEALDEIAGKLAEYARDSGPESVVFSFASPSAASISDSLPWLERFVWTYGSPNICWATELCNWHKDHMHKLTVGTGLPVPDYANSDLIVLWGHNPEKVWLAQAEKIAGALQRGAELVLVDPRKTGMASQAAQWLRVRPGSDGALALGLIRLLLTDEGFDETFVRQWSNAPFLVREDTGALLRAGDAGLTPADAFVAFDASRGAPVAIDTRHALDPSLSENLDLFHTGEIALADGGTVACKTAFAELRQASAPFTPEHVAETCNIDPKDLHAFARRLASAKSVSYYCWTGVGQQGNATQTDRAIACVFALTGQYDTPGGNVTWPSIPIEPISSYAKLPREQAEKSLGYQTRPLGPASGGWVTGSEVYRGILEEKPYRVRALVSFGSNVLSSQPDPDRGRAALEKLDLQVHCDMFLNPSAMSADIILPVNSAWERDGLRAGFEISLAAQETLQLRPAMVPPRGEARSDFDIVAALAVRLGFGEQFGHGDWDAAHDAILAPIGVTTDDLRRAPMGLTIPLEHGFCSYATPRPDGTVAGFPTPSRRIEFHSCKLQAHGYPAVPDFVPPEQPTEDAPLILTTAKSGYYCHTQHRGLNMLRRKSRTPRVDLHPDTAAERGIAEGATVHLLRNGARITMEAHIDPALDPGVVVAGYGWWQGAPDIGAPAYEIRGESDANYNSLAGFDRLDPVSGAPAVRSMCCEVEPAGTATSPWTGYRPLTVTNTTCIAPGVTELTLASEDETPLTCFKPGQFISLRLPGAEDPTLSRSYSLTGLPGTAPTSYRVGIRRLDDGALSGALSDLKPGDSVLAAAPDGHFTLPVENEFPVVLIAAGIGITPFISLLEHVAQHGGPEVHLYYGSRNGAEHAFRDRIEALSTASGRITVHNFYSRPRPEETVDHLTGRLSPERIDPALLRRRARFYMCGPDEMLSTFRKSLDDMDVPAFEVFHERFTAPPRVSATDLAPQQVHFSRQNKTLRWTPADGSLLDLAGKHGLALPSGCRTGQCESCAAAVISGEVGHYTEVETDDPQQCLTCQAYPVSSVTLDA